MLVNCAQEDVTGNITTNTELTANNTYCLKGLLEYKVALHNNTAGKKIYGANDGSPDPG
jgi:hypothetical protein